MFVWGRGEGVRGRDRERELGVQRYVDGLSAEIPHPPSKPVLGGKGHDTVKTVNSFPCIVFVNCTVFEECIFI